MYFIKDLLEKILSIDKKLVPLPTEIKYKLKKLNIMKKEDAKKLLDNIKVYVSNRSELIQEKLFSIGYVWSNNKNKVKVAHTDCPFLYLSNGTISCGKDMNAFLNNLSKEVSTDDILDIKIDKEFDFKLYDKVLVRDLDSEVWIPALYKDYFSENTHPYAMVQVINNFEQCIPYNDKTKHLLGTTDKYQD